MRVLALLMLCCFFLMCKVFAQSIPQTSFKAAVHLAAPIYNVVEGQVEVHCANCPVVLHEGSVTVSDSSIVALLSDGTGLSTCTVPNMTLQLTNFTRGLNVVDNTLMGDLLVTYGPVTDLPVGTRCIFWDTDGGFFIIDLTSPSCPDELTQSGCRMTAEGDSTSRSSIVKFFVDGIGGLPSDIAASDQASQTPTEASEVKRPASSAASSAAIYYTFVLLVVFAVLLSTGIQPLFFTI